jgi:hypothetical protein
LHCPSLAHAAFGLGLIPQIGPYSVGMRVVQQYDHARGMERAVNAVGELTPRRRIAPCANAALVPGQGGGHVNEGD